MFLPPIIRRTRPRPAYLEHRTPAALTDPVQGPDLPGQAGHVESRQVLQGHPARYGTEVQHLHQCHLWPGRVDKGQETGGRGQGAGVEESNVGGGPAVSTLTGRTGKRNTPPKP